MTVTVADALAQRMWDHGTREIFAQSLPSKLILAAEKQGIRQVSYRTENAGGAMADGYARASNKVTFVGAQNGPAATLLVPPMYEAMLVSVPMVALVQEVPVSAQDKNAFQEIDHVELFSGCSKWTRTINDPDRAQEYLDAAIRVATTGKPGPVVLLLPKDILAQTTDNLLDPTTATGIHFPLDRIRPTDDAVQEAAAKIAAAQRPVVVVGGGVIRSQAQQEIRELQEVAHLPVATTNMGKGSVEESHPLSMGVIGNAMGVRSTAQHMNRLLGDSDLFLFVGNRTNENGTDSWSIFPKSAQYIHLDLSPEEVGRNYSSARLVGDAKVTLAALTDALRSLDLGNRESQRAALEQEIGQARKDSADAFSQEVNLDSSPIRPERVMSELDALANDDAIFVADASYSSIWLSNYIKSHSDRTFMYPRGMAGLGWGLPMAIGAKTAEPQRQVVCITGDGGFGHVWQELETAVRMDIPLTVILMNNGILGFQRHSELVQFSEHTTAVRFAPVNHAAIAEAVGATGIRVSEPSEIQSALSEALKSNKVTLIEVMADENAYPPITGWQESKDVLWENRRVHQDQA